MSPPQISFISNEVPVSWVIAKHVFALLQMNYSIVPPNWEFLGNFFLLQQMAEHRNLDGPSVCGYTLSIGFVRLCLLFGSAIFNYIMSVKFSDQRDLQTIYVRNIYHMYV